MKLLRIQIALFAAITCSPCLATEPASPDPQKEFARAVELIEQQKHAEAVPILQALGEEYSNDTIFWNLGLAATEAHENRIALNAWLRFREVSPGDWRGRAKLVQAYQATNNITARDAERAELLRLWTEGKDPELSKQKLFCREQIIEEKRRVFVFEYFHPTGERMVFYSFHVQTPGAEEYKISLGSYEGTNQVAWETGTLARDKRVFHLDMYAPDLHKTYGFYDGQPSYETVRAAVIAILSGEAKAVSSTTTTKDGADIEITVDE